jgi:D-alanyl-D-alanine carboxypeptidase/D-alanyl-D-alanine-endopeptidase (penicillin-binding protein 4)
MWTVARGALGDSGGRWLPVRRPSAYLAEVFQMLARNRGIALGAPVFSESAPANARVLVEHASDPLEDILRGMMRWSTNLTAEVVGLAATQAGGVRPATPGRERGRNERLDARAPRRAAGAVRGSFGPWRRQPHPAPRHDPRAGRGRAEFGMLRGLMRDIPILDVTGAPIPTTRSRSWPRPAR